MLSPHPPRKLWRGRCCGRRRYATCDQVSGVEAIRIFDNISFKIVVCESGAAGGAGEEIEDAGFDLL